MSNHVKNIAIVGAGGQCGGYVAKELVKSGRFQVTAISRAGSTNKIPEGITVASVDYESHNSLVAALKGQDVLIITMAVTAPPDTQEKLIKAAADASVPWILPNEWGCDASNPEVNKDNMIGERIQTARKLITDLGKSSYIAITCGFWYEYSLSVGPFAYGFNFRDKEVTFYGDGTPKLNTSTFPQVAQAVAALLSFPIEPESSGRSLSQYRNSVVQIASFLVSQRDMLDSVLRVTGEPESAWTIKTQPARERYDEGMAQLKTGDHAGFGKLLYARYFYGDGAGIFESRAGLNNDELGLKKGDQAELDKFTKTAVDWANNYGQVGVDKASMAEVRPENTYK